MTATPGASTQHPANLPGQSTSRARLIQHSETLITWAAITLMTRRLARKGATPSWPRKPAPTNGSAP